MRNNKKGTNKRRMHRVGIRIKEQVFSEEEIQKLIKENVAAPPKETESHKGNLGRFGNTMVLGHHSSLLDKKARKNDENLFGIICVEGSDRKLKAGVPNVGTTLGKGKTKKNTLK
jgi:hypothetical protein